MKRLLNEPVLISGAIRAVILALVAFGFTITPELLASLMLAVEAVLALVTRALVTPNQLAEARVAQGLSPTQPRDSSGGPPPIPVILLACVLSAQSLTGCAKAGPQLSPEGKVAYYGDMFLEGVELAQDKTIALVGTSIAGRTITKADVTPAVEVFVEIGKVGQKLAVTLREMDAAGTDLDKAAAIARTVDGVIRSLQGLAESITVKVQSELVRTAVDNIIKVVQVSSKLLDIYRVVAPYLPRGTAALPEVVHGHA